jgi:predicted NBD/HSP70 family sugar kinase
MESGRLRPHDTCRASGIYRAYHYQHRLPHTVVLMAGDQVPQCRKCGDAVCFEFLLSGERIGADLDFGDTAQANNTTAGR